MGRHRVNPDEWVVAHCPAEYHRYIGSRNHFPEPKHCLPHRRWSYAGGLPDTQH